MKITGEEKTSKLKETLRKVNDPNTYVVAEFGVGFNPRAKVRGISNIEDEATLGTAYIAVGDNHTMGETSLNAHRRDSDETPRFIWIAGF